MLTPKNGVAYIKKTRVMCCKSYLYMDLKKRKQSSSKKEGNFFQARSDLALIKFNYAAV